MKRKILITSISFISLFLLAAFTIIKSSGAHPGSTGAPDDLTCAQNGCHQDALVIPNAVNNNTLLFSTPDSSYFPGQPYTITVQVQGSGVNPITRFGFEIQPLRDADSMQAGQFTITQAARTQIISHFAKGAMRYSVTHKTNGTPALSSNYNEWIMTWTAPPVNVGNITFYYATNCTNDNGQNTGDRIYLHKFQIHPNPSVSLKELNDQYQLMSYYVKNSNEIIIKYNLFATRTVELCIYNIEGKIIHADPASTLSGLQKKNIKLSENTAKGVYIVQLKIGEEKLVKRIVVN